MDPRLEDANKTLATIGEEHDSQRELAFAILAVDENDPATLNWLAACAVARASELTP